jgi:hypothetical protein
MSQLVKTKRQANFKRFGAFKGLVEQKKPVFNSFVCKLAHSCQKKPKLHKDSLYKVLFKNVVSCVDKSAAALSGRTCGVQ